MQADLRAFHHYGLHGCTVFAALTAQNPFGVSAVHPVPPDFVAAQLDAVLGVYNIRALKTGMLAEIGVIETVAERLRRHPEISKVIDPVMVATSGAKLISDNAVATLKSQLLPLATIVTPNIPEAEVLCGRSGTPAEMAKRIHGEFGAAVLVKGGHGDGDSSVDVLCDDRGNICEFSSQRIIDPVSTHGTGCSLAAALAAELALDHSLADAVRGAKQFVHAAIANSFFVGRDCGVLGFVEQL